MKMYTEKQNAGKSWAITLRDDDGDIDVCAVDAYTGRTISHIIGFLPAGEVVIYEDVTEELREEGYDPHEHGNMFDDRGRIKTKEGI